MKPDRFIKIFFMPLLALLVIAVPAAGKDELVVQDDVPYGAASDYLIGRQLLKEGQYAEALSYLHLVYRTHPDVPAVAVDFQEALVAEGYFKDALGVMDRLVADYPDSLAFLLQRSNLNLQLGEADAALRDLRVIREQGGANLEVIIAEANLLGAQGELNQALDVYRDGVHLFPEEGDQMYLGMTALLQRAQKEEAIPPLLEEALQQYPDSPELWLVRVRSLAGLGKHSEALSAARQADAHFLEIQSSTPPETPEDDPASAHLPAGHPVPELSDPFMVELADFYVQQGQIDRAVDILSPMHESGELGMSPTLWLARILIGTGQIEAGRLLVEGAIERWPDAGRAWFLKGKILEGEDNWGEAIPFFDKAAVLAPHDPEIRLALVRSMLVGWETDLSAKEPNTIQAERRANVEKHAIAALTLVSSQDTEGQLVLGYAFRTLEDPWRAEGCFELAAANPELQISAQTLRSICFDEIGDSIKARQVLEKLQVDFPNHPEVANSLGYFLAEKGEDLEKAQQLIQVALDAQPGNGAFLDSMGWVLYRLGLTESAFDYMIQAVNALPDDPVILEHLAMVLLELGQTQEGVGMLERALALGGERLRIEAVLEGLSVDQPDNSDSQGP